MAHKGAPFGNKNASGRHKGGAPKFGQSKGLRAHLGSKVNYNSAGFKRAAAAQKRRGF
jgi:hypothetical protein